MSGLKTTAPLRSLKASNSAPSSLAIRWVHPTVEGPVTPLDGARFLLGRGEKCRTRLDADAVSRYHAEVRVEGEVPTIRDLGSTNGVHVNGAPIEECPLRTGDVVRLGASVGVVVQGESRSDFGEPYPGLLAGPAFWPVVEAAQALARTDLPVVIQGETGTGKERMARAVHGWSDRGGEFVAINCAALPESLAEAELFGYRRGAFTGADRSSPGHFRAADGGTLLLDEIVDLPLALQAKVLRAIESREVVPLGETRPIRVDVRLVAAAQASLHEAVAQKKFRADLLARLDAATIELPPLRRRIQEVPFLFARLASRRGTNPPAVDPRLVEVLCRHAWPFNVRELDLLVRRMIALHGAEPALLVDHLPERFLAPPSGVAEADRHGRMQVAGDARREGPSTPADDARDLAALVDALRDNGGNVARAATRVGISRPRAYRLIRGRGDIDLDAIRSGRTSD